MVTMFIHNIVQLLPRHYPKLPAVGTGVNLYQIAVHEIGHSLGLKHSKVKDSVMWPKHDGYVANYTLHDDDIDAIQVNA